MTRYIYIGGSLSAVTSYDFYDSNGQLVTDQIPTGKLDDGTIIYTTVPRHAFPGGLGSGDTLEFFATATQGSISVDILANGSLEGGSVTASTVQSAAVNGGSIAASTVQQATVNGSQATLTAETLDGRIDVTAGAAVTVGIVDQSSYISVTGSGSSAVVTALSSLTSSASAQPGALAQIDVTSGAKATVGSANQSSYITVNGAGSSAGLTNLGASITSDTHAILAIGTGGTAAINAVANKAALYVEGAGSTLTIQTVSFSGIDNLFNILDGGSVSIASSFATDALKDDTSTIIVDGFGSKLTTSEPLVIGRVGNSIFTIADGAGEAYGGLTVGQGATSFGSTSVQSGSSLTVNGNAIIADGATGGITIGDRNSVGGFLSIVGGVAKVAGDFITANLIGSTADFTVQNNGSLTVTGSATIGNAGISDDIASLQDIYGGGILKVAQKLTLGALAGAVGGLAASDSGSKISVGGDTVIGQVGGGEVRIGAGASFATLGSVTVAAESKSRGALRFTGNSGDGSGAFVAAATGTIAQNLNVGAAGQGGLRVDHRATLTVGGGLTVGQANSTAEIVRIDHNAQLTSGNIKIDGVGSSFVVDHDGSVVIAGSLSLEGGSKSPTPITIDAIPGIIGTDLSFDGNTQLDILSGGSVHVGTIANRRDATLGLGTSSKVVVSVDGISTASQVSSLFDISGALTMGGLTGGSAELDLTNGGAVNVGKTLTIGVGSLVAGIGLISASQISDAGLIESRGGKLKISADVSGTGGLQIDDEFTLELTGAVTASQITFQSRNGTLLIDRPTEFQSKISGLFEADPSVPASLSNVHDIIELANMNNVYDSTIYTDPVSKQSTLYVYEGVKTNTTAILSFAVAGQNGQPLSDLNDFFAVSQVTNPTTFQTDTVLTLTAGNPVALTVNAQKVWNSNITGSQIKIGVISNSDAEAKAMAEVVKAVAPGAIATPFSIASDLADEVLFADDIGFFQQGGYQIVVDDIGTVGDDADLRNIIKAAATGIELLVDKTAPLGVAVGIEKVPPMTFLTAIGNSNQGPPTPHQGDPNEITVGAVNWLNTPFGGLTPFQSETFSDPTPDVSAPDAGPVDFPASLVPLIEQPINPFFGTSAAAPVVAGIVALMMQANPELEKSPSQIEQLLEDSALKFGDPSVSGAGLVQADRAVQLAEQVACYCAGTLILTSHGEIPVEQLAIGDRLFTNTGELRLIKWIGRRSYSGRFILRRKDILPICIKASALSENTPRRDLWISPHHAMYLDDVLIEAKDLLNDVTIVQAEHVEKVEYFHIELESHGVIFAEGAPSETFVDFDCRSMFHNAHEYSASHAKAPVQPARYCAPRFDSGYEVEAVRRRLARWAGLAYPEQAAGLMRGNVDMVSAERVAGWAQNLDHPEAPVCLDIYVEGRLVGQALANTYREDLKQVGIGSGRHAFVFTPPPEMMVRADQVSVRRSFDGAVLQSAKQSSTGPAQVA